MYKLPAIKIGFKNILQLLIILIFNSFLGIANAQTKTDSKVIKDTVKLKDTVLSGQGRLNDVVRYKADNNRNDLPKKMTFLNKNASVNYEDMQIEADYISIDWNTGDIFARGKLNENGRVVSPVITTQAGKKYETDNFNFNFKSRRAMAFNTRTEESEGVIVAEKTKKYNDSVFFMRRGKYTTDEYFLKKKDTLADYYLLAPTIKMIKGKNNSQVVTGPIQMYIERVPTPLILPFAILPITDKRSAGILIPSFGEREDVGFFLNGLGYYQPIGEHFDVKVLADVYTKGSWNIRPEVNYKKNYKYSGNFTADIGTTVRGIKGLDNYSKMGTYRIGWRHSQDSKANPFLHFSASVDIVSSKFYNNTINNNYIFGQNVLNTQQNSSISVTKRFLTLPVTITGTSSYSQNFSTGLTDLRLPQLNVSVNQFYLFKPKTGIRQGLLENLTVNTGLNFVNYVSAKQGEMFTKTMWDKMQTGLKNNISLSTNTTVAKYFTLSLSADVNNVLTTKTLTRTYNPVTNELENVYNKKIAGFSTFSTSASMQTVLYGRKDFGRNSAIQAIRHMVTPSIGFTYSPDFGEKQWGYFNNYYDANGLLTKYSIFDGGVFGSPGYGLQEAVTFNINNNLEMKVRSKKDSTGVKKVKIFENLNLSGGYNFAAPSHKWDYFRLSGQSSFLNNKLSINSSLTLDPYEVVFNGDDAYGTRTENFGKFSVQNFNVQLSFPLSEAILGEKEDLAKKYDTKGEIRNEHYFFDADHYAHFSQPWSLNINAQYAYSRNLTRFGTRMASLGLDGSIKLTPFWNINGSTHYDFISRELAYTRLGFSRDQRSFTINFNWVPFGRYKVYDFFIGIKANILRDAVKYKDHGVTQPNAPF